MQITQHIERHVESMDENATVREAADRMVDKFIGSVVVTGAWGIKGIFSERDIVMQVVACGKDPAATKLCEALEPAFIVKVQVDATAEECLEQMRKHRCRHLLVFNGEEFEGIVSLRDLVVLMLEEREVLIEELKKYITA